MKPKISVIIPIFNAESYLNQCIESIVSQTFKEIEILLIDDGSTDNSLKICLEQAENDKRIRVFSNHNCGQGLERNFGIDKAQGEYVYFIDSDDMAKPRMLEIMYDRAKKYDADIVSVGYEDIYADFRREEHFLENCIFSNAQLIHGAMADLIGSKENDTYKGCIAVWDSLFKKEVIDNYNIRFVSERVVYSEDLLFKLDVMNHSKTIVWLNDALYQYRVNEQSFTNGVSNEVVDRIVNLYHLLLGRFESTLGNLSLNERLINRTFFTLRFNINKAVYSKNRNDFYQYIYENRELNKILKNYIPDSLKNNLFFILFRTKKLNLVKIFASFNRH